MTAFAWTLLSLPYHDWLETKCLESSTEARLKANARAIQLAPTLLRP